MPKAVLKSLFLLGLVLAGPASGSDSGSGANSGLIVPNLRFNHLSARDGIVAGEVRAIIQDRELMVWIGTESGLCRYDGYQVRTFRNSLAQGDSLSNNSVADLVEDADGTIWVATENGFLDRLDPKTGLFAHYVVKLGNDSKSRLDGIQKLLIDRNRQLWVGSGEGVILIEPDRRASRVVARADEKSWRCTALIEAAAGGLWAGSEDGEILRYEDKSGRFEVVGTATGRIEHLLEDSQGRLMASVNGSGLLVWDGKSEAGGNWVTLHDDPTVLTAVVGSNGRVWSGSGDGLTRLDPRSGQMVSFRQDLNDIGSLNGVGVSSLFVDRSGVLWVGYRSGGVSRVLLDHPWFEKFANSVEGGPGLTDRSVSAILSAREGGIWIGTGRGLDYWVAGGAQIVNDVFSFQFPEEGAGRVPTAVFEDSRGKVWVGTRDGRIFFTHPPVGDEALAGAGERRLLPESLSGEITSILEDPSGQLWIGSRGGGIATVGPDGQWRGAMLPGGPEGLGDRFINDLCLAPDGTIWVATSSDGVLHYDPVARRFVQADHLSGGEVLDLLFDSEGHLWCGTAGRGLTRLDLAANEVMTINRRNSSEANPLPDDTVRGLIEDKSGHLWISTDRGVARMDRKTFEFRPFDEHDGLQSDVFHSRVAAVCRQGRLLFGGPNGLSVIDPESLPEPRRAERAILTGLELFGDPVTPSPDGILKRPLALTDEITIPHTRHGRIGFRFATLDYTTPRRSQFRYRLEGVEDDWQMADDNRQATYTGLLPGSYRFVVESSSDGVQWNDQSANVRLVVRPAWYAHPLTRIGLGLLAILLLVYLFIHRSRVREETLRRQQEQLQVKYSRAEAALARQLQHAMLLEQTGLALASDDDSGNLLANALRQFGEAFGVARSFVRSGTTGIDGYRRGDFTLIAEYIDPSIQGKRDKSGPDMLDGERFVTKLLRSDRSFAISDVSSRPDLFPDTSGFQDCGTQSILAVRTLHQGEPNGYVVLQHCGEVREWQADEIKLLESLAGQFGMVLAQIAQQERDERHRRELEKAKHEADLANRSKSDFLAKMTHELRTPLNAIIGFSELLSDDHDLTHRQRETLDIINHSGEHLLGVINDILEVSKIEAGKVEMRQERFNLSNLLASVYEMLAFGAKNKGLSFSIDKIGDLPGDIIADKGKLRQVLVNLVGNATKFTESGGISISVRASQLLPDSNRRYIGFEIRDSGPGIAEEELPKLFEKFTQTESGQKARRGTGLGLAISKAFVEMMGGWVEVASTVGVGTVFRFTILCEEATGEGTVAATGEGGFAPVATGQRGRRLAAGHPEVRILIVEDQPANRLLATRILRSAGFALCEAENGAEGVEKWRSFHPHLILMDEEMPVMRGREATRIIREESGDNGPVIVALTAFALDETRLAALSNGSDDFLAKPFRIDDLLGMISRHLPVEFESGPDAAAA